MVGSNGQNSQATRNVHQVARDSSHQIVLSVPVMRGRIAHRVRVVLAGPSGRSIQIVRSVRVVMTDRNGSKGRIGRASHSHRTKRNGREDKTG
jgi:hypothetical protein